MHKVISTRAHGVIDYAFGSLLVFLPKILNFSGETETYLPMTVGMIIMGTTLLTDFEAGALKKIPIRTHLRLDMTSGALLALSPWLFHLESYALWPLLTLGSGFAAIALLTQLQPRTTLVAKF